jgi:hypothetical protein
MSAVLLELAPETLAQTEHGGVFRWPDLISLTYSRDTTRREYLKLVAALPTGIQQVAEFLSQEGDTHVHYVDAKPERHLRLVR